MSTRAYVLLCFCILAVDAQIQIQMNIVGSNPDTDSESLQSALVVEGADVVDFSEYNEAVNTTECIPGYYCRGINVSVPAPCPAGTFLPTAGGKSVSDCIPCIAGAYCYEGSASPTNCSAGTYSAQTGASSASACLTCPLGQYCPNDGMTQGLSCGTGVFSSTGVIWQWQCQLCQQGFYCIPSSDEPVPCPAGTYQPSLGANSSAACLLCPKGNYCPTQSVIPTPCPVGTYNSLQAGTSVAACHACPAGTYCLQGSAAPSNCTPGSYTNTPASSTCLACNLGTYSVAAGLPTPCPACPLGSYCPNPTTIEKCPTYTTSASGASSQLNCICYPGFVCTYAKHVSMTVELTNLTLQDFQNNVGGCRDQFIAALAAASGVPVSAVVINGITPVGSGRRSMPNPQDSNSMQSLFKEDTGLHVHCVVHSATDVRALHEHMASRGIVMRRYVSVVTERVRARRSGPDRVGSQVP